MKDLKLSSKMKNGLDESTQGVTAWDVYLLVKLLVLTFQQIEPSTAQITNFLVKLDALTLWARYAGTLFCGLFGELRKLVLEIPLSSNPHELNDSPRAPEVLLSVHAAM